MTVIKRREGMRPTPCASGDLHCRLDGNSQASKCLAVAVYPTPTARDAAGCSPNEKPRDKLCFAIERGVTKSHTYPTPQTDHMGGGVNARKKLQALEREGKLTDKERRGMEMKTHGLQLNPDWVEWLMAWPVGWTDIETPNIRLVWLDPSIDPADSGEIPRVTNRRDNRPARIKALGNGQFPPTAAVAFHWGLCVLEVVP